ncbi:ParB/RepB/Spo0J family partition protein, partial [Actinomadura adrarensis]
TNTLRLLNLPPNVQTSLAAGVLSAGHARALLGLDSEEEQEAMALRIIREGLSVRSVEEIIKFRDGVGAPKPRQGRRRKQIDPDLQHLADRLSDRYDTKVRVDKGAKKGKIVIEFATDEDLERILKTMVPDEDRPDF